MRLLASCSLLSALLLQAAPAPPPFPEGMFTEKEREKIDKNADDLGKRIEVYRDASARMHKALGKSVSAGDFGPVPGQLEAWVRFLAESVKDIEANTDPEKKRLKALIRYEIDVRKAINDLRNYRVRAPAAQQDAFERCVGRADALRGTMVDLLFRPEDVVGRKEAE